MLLHTATCGYMLLLLHAAAACYYVLLVLLLLVLLLLLLLLRLQLLRLLSLLSMRASLAPSHTPRPFVQAGAGAERGGAGAERARREAAEREARQAAAAEQARREAAEREQRELDKVAAALAPWTLGCSSWRSTGRQPRVCRSTSCFLPSSS